MARRPQTRYGNLNREIAQADQKAVEAQLTGNGPAYAEWRAIGDHLRDLRYLQDHLRSSK